MKHLDRTHILTRIVEAKRKRLQVSRTRVPEAIVKRMAETAKPVSSFREALGNEQRVRIIAEVKKTSPSKGVLREGLDPFALAGAYMKAGACAISVVTEEDFFQGDQPASPAKRFRLGTFPGLRDTRRWSERNPLDHGDARAWRIERTYRAFEPARA